MAKSTREFRTGSMVQLVAPILNVGYMFDIQIYSVDTWKLGDRVDHMILYDYHHPKQKCQVLCLDET